MIRYYRVQAGLKQKELALKIGVSETTISKWENGQALPSLENLRKLEDLFHVSLRHAYPVCSKGASLKNVMTTAQLMRALQDVKAELDSVKHRKQQLEMLLANSPYRPCNNSI